MLKSEKERQSSHLLSGFAAEIKALIARASLPKPPIRENFSHLWGGLRARASLAAPTDVALPCCSPSLLGHAGFSSPVPHPRGCHLGCAFCSEDFAQRRQIPLFLPYLRVATARASHILVSKLGNTSDSSSSL